MTEVRIVTDTSFDAHPRLAYDLFLPENPVAEAPLIVALHGGWWHQGSRQDLHASALALALRGYPVATLGFRRLRDISGQDGAEMVGDVVAGCKKALEGGFTYGCDRRRIALLGVESGATLALVAGAQLLKAREVRVRGVIAIDGCYDLGKDLDLLDPAIAKHGQAFVKDHKKKLDPMQIYGQLLPATLFLHRADNADISVERARVLHEKIVDEKATCAFETIEGAPAEALAHPRQAAVSAALDRACEWLANPPLPELDAPAIGEPEWARLGACNE